LHHKVQKFSSGTGSPRWSRKKSRETVVIVVVVMCVDEENDAEDVDESDRAAEVSVSY